MLAKLPWSDRELFLLNGVVPLAGERMMLVDADGTALALAGRSHELLLALSGGHPIALSGEWDGYRFAPLCAWSEGRAVSLVRSVP